MVFNKVTFRKIYNIINNIKHNYICHWFFFQYWHVRNRCLLQLKTLGHPNLVLSPSAFTLYIYSPMKLSNSNALILRSYILQIHALSLLLPVQRSVKKRAIALGKNHKSLDEDEVKERIFTGHPLLLSFPSPLPCFTLLALALALLALAHPRPFLPLPPSLHPHALARSPLPACPCPLALALARSLVHHFSKT